VPAGQPLTEVVPDEPAPHAVAIDVAPDITTDDADGASTA
jgi:hypothetical protein